MLNERDIKTALIDRLFEKGMLEDAVLINEMVVANWDRRADIAVANGRLYAFEIKSDLDTLDRLEGQVAAYLGRFDKVTVVTTPKFLTVVSSQMPNEVEIWEASGESGAVKLRIVRRGRTQEITSRRMLCGFLLKAELVSLLRGNGLTIGADARRESLISLAQELPVITLRKYVLSCLKARYQKTFEKFVEGKGTKTKLSDLDNLSKSKLILRERDRSSDVSVEDRVEKARSYRILNLDALTQRYGPIPDDMPGTVLLRSVRSSN